VSPVRPKKALGQHFLVDDNILGVIGRLAQLSAADVVLEIGPGLGVLTRYLADRVAHVHAVELDRTLEEPLLKAIEGRGNVQLIWGDALRLDLSALTPVPHKLVANLPYSVATPLLVESLTGLPAIERWCVMVQREVADRLAALPRTKEYGAVSVLIQLATRRTGFHAVSRHVFRPAPRVDSALVALERIPPPEDFVAVHRLVDAAFSHRRKTLANALQLSGVASREPVVTALSAIGHAANVRAEALRPDEFVALWRALAGDRVSRPAHHAG
jgi:16S rRNA (adenine1518-N6/adenine1519-N6)-dimethyltransferase